MKRLIVAATCLAAPALLATPAAAQDEGGERVNQLIIYGDDECPESTEGEITVCARKDESERYRIPEILRQSDDPENVAWTQRVKQYETVGANGIMSCSPVGAGGELGCTQQLIDAAYAEKATGSDVRFSQLIEEERAKRLSTIDEDAAEEQARVEELERQYMEKLERERAGEDAAASEEPATDPGDETPAEEPAE